MPKRGPADDEEVVLDEADLFVEVPTVRTNQVVPEEAYGAEGVVPQSLIDAELGAAPVAEEGEIPLIAAPLPEMSPEIWQAGIQAIVSVPDTVPAPPWPDDEAWRAEARLFRAEADLAESVEEAAALRLAAGRAAALAGSPDDAIGFCEEALDLTPNAPDAVRARARLAEGREDFDRAQALWAQLAQVAQTADDRVFYRALAAEWTLARTGRLPLPLREAWTGPARALAIVEEAMLARKPGEVSALLAQAGRSLGGSLGAALVEEAARFAETAGDVRGADALRAAAMEVDREARPGILSTLRDAARMNDRDAARLLGELTSRLPAASPLAHAITRWGIRLARRRGENALAATMLEGLPPVTSVAARDRIDVQVATGAPLDGESLERLRAGEGGTPAGVVTLTWIEAASLLARGDATVAAALIARAVGEHPDAVPLGLLAEEIAGKTTDPKAREAALEAWFVADPARRAEAGLSRAGGAPGGDAELSEPAREALRGAVAAAPGSALFWTLAEAEGRAGRHAEAAAAILMGADAWAGGPLAAALRACAAARVAPVDAAAALAALDAPGATAAFGEEAQARLSERAGNWTLWSAALALAAEGSPDVGRRAALMARRAAKMESANDRRRTLAGALERVPDHPIALPLLLIGGEIAFEDAADALWRAGETKGGDASEAASPYARFLGVAAALASALAGRREEARDRAARLAPRDGRHLRLAYLRARGGQGELALGPGGEDPADAIALLWAEALAESGSDAAPAAFERLVAGRFAADARRGLRRLGAPGVPGLPPALLRGAPDEEAAEMSASLAGLVSDVREGRWEAALRAIESRPPHELQARGDTLQSLAAVAEGRLPAPAAPSAAARLEVDAVRAAGDEVEPLSLPALGRVAERAAEPELRARALELAIAQLRPDPPPEGGEVIDATDDRSVLLAPLYAALARVRAEAGEGDRALDGWRAALAADPGYLPAALALRREAAGRGDVRGAVDATETEAGCLLVRAHRVRTLILAAALAAEDPGAGHERAAGLLRSALAIDPTHEGAFEQLRALLEDRDDARGLAAALAARIAVAANPFEVTSLRLARAELLAGKLSDRTGARGELEGILQRQPEHPRALARLSDLEWEDERWGEAAEIYVRRTAVERNPRTLREIFLRLGQIHSRRIPDPKRAIAAYERVLDLEPDNREALEALSELHLEAGDPKLALPPTERLVALEPEPKRRTAFRVRLGEILVRTGDLRRAGVELRRAVDGRPRDVAAVSALAALLDRARDQAGRRAVLDHSVGLLRHDVERGELDLETLRGLATLLALRERPRAAAAAAQLVSALEAGDGDRASGAGRPVRHLEALRRPELDERAFPPGLPPGIRQIMRLAGPSLRASGAELVHQLSRHGVTRTDRVGRNEPPRPLFESMAAMVGASEFELYVKAPPGRAAPVPVRVEPGSPAAVIIGAPIVDFGPAALRFAAARTLRLVATNLDLLLAEPPEEAAALLVGIIRQFVPDYQHPDVREVLVEPEAARAARLIPRRLRNQLMPFAIESAGRFDPVALHAAVRDGANAVGLLACADLPAALSVVLATAGLSAASPTLEVGLALSPIVAHPEALALLRFAVSDDYDDLALAMESG